MKKVYTTYSYDDIHACHLVLKFETMVIEAVEDPE